MPRRPRSNKKSDPSIPKPPDRKAFEQQRADATPKADQRLLEHRRRPEPPRELFADNVWPSPEKRDIADERRKPDALVVPLRCAKNGAHFAIEFRKRLLGRSWAVSDAYLLGASAAVQPNHAEKIDLASMNWDGAVCPACKAKCRPIFCGNDHYTCDGGTSELPSGECFHSCACGRSGKLTPSLRDVSAGRGGSPRNPGGGNTSSPVRPLLLRYQKE